MSATSWLSDLWFESLVRGTVQKIRLPPQSSSATNFDRLMIAETGPLLLDLRAFEIVRNWNWLSIPLHRDCQAQGRKWMICVQSKVAEVLTVTKLDRLLPISTDFDDALVSLS